MTGRAGQRLRAPIPATPSGPAASGPAASGPAASGPRRRRPIVFGLHQFFEYLLAAALVVLSVHLGGSTLLLVAGAVLGLLALTARGPLGLVRICGPRLHATLDIVAGLLLALSPLVRSLRPGIVGLVAIELVAVAWLRVATLTRYSVGPRGPISATVGGDVADPNAPRPRRPDPAEAPPGPTLSAVKELGRLTAGARNRLPEAKTALDSGARAMGSHAGRLQRAWRRATR